MANTSPLVNENLCQDIHPNKQPSWTLQNEDSEKELIFHKEENEVPRPQTKSGKKLKTEDICATLKLEQSEYWRIRESLDPDLFDAKYPQFRQIPSTALNSTYRNLMGHPRIRENVEWAHKIRNNHWFRHHLIHANWYTYRRTVRKKKETEGKESAER
ncbi:hypothetical protein BDZ91DRAFT_179161 [Kalaharituber pfeilii]|nr:hypothetical protein BDZ91DRAFT_179161 [Kalaharituber pfeilii]